MIRRGLKYWRESATVMLIARAGKKQQHNMKISDVNKVQNTPHSGHGSSSTAVFSSTADSHASHFDYRILMLERNSKSKFMPSAFVFPGGAVGNHDFSQEWNSIFIKSGFADVNTTNLGLPIVSQNLSDRSPMYTTAVDNYIHPEAAFRINAIRETFEECGILLYLNWKNNTTKLDKRVLKDWRSIVYRNDEKFLDMCNELKVVPDIWSLHEWSNWLTPTNMDAMHGGKRFDTAFYICTMKKSIDAVHDEQETVSSQV